MGAHRKNPPKDAAATIESLASQGHAIIGIAKQLGVSRETFKRWCEEDDALQEAFEVGRETERQALHALIVQSAVLNKPANVNAFFILKCRHSYRENDSPNTNINVGVAVAPVMVVKDFGSDAEWAARAAEHQRALILDAPSPPKQIQTTQTESYAPPVASAPSWGAYEPSTVAARQPAPLSPHQYKPSEWRGNA